MFGLTANETGEESAQLLEEFVSLQKEIFSALELHYRSEKAHNKILQRIVDHRFLCVIWSLFFLECWTCQHRSWVLQPTESMTLKPGCPGGTVMARSVT